MVTSRDVARLAGVSQPTVSRALRGVSGTSAETIERVRAAATALGYVPSEAGRSLSTARTRCVGVVAAELTNPFYPELVEPLRSELERHGYRTLLIPDSTEAPLEIERLADGTLDGVILTTTLVNSRLPLDLAARGIPYVLVNRTVDQLVADSCSFDNHSGATVAAQHLVGLGHTQVGMISGPESTSTGRDRALAFSTAMNSLGVDVPSARVRSGAFSFITGYLFMQELLRLETAPTAVFCGNDVIAIGACNALAANNLSSWHDVAIVGFDDIAMASWALHQLTTVHCDHDDLARESVRLLLRRIDDPAAVAEQVVLPTALVTRRSTSQSLR